jgi:hypothetical protein
MEEKKIKRVVWFWCCSCCAAPIPRRIKPVRDRKGRRYCNARHRRAFQKYRALGEQAAKEVKKHLANPQAINHSYVADVSLRKFLKEEKQRAEKRRALS